MSKQAVHIVTTLLQKLNILLCVHISTRTYVASFGSEHGALRNIAVVEFYLFRALARH
jgi:hypothetical protein